MNIYEDTTLEEKWLNGYCKSIDFSKILRTILYYLYYLTILPIT